MHTQSKKNKNHIHLRSCSLIIALAVWVVQNLLASITINSSKMFLKGSYYRYLTLVQVQVNHSDCHHLPHPYHHHLIVRLLKTTNLEIELVHRRQSPFSSNHNKPRDFMTLRFCLMRLLLMNKTKIISIPEAINATSNKRPQLIFQLYYFD